MNARVALVRLSVLVGLACLLQANRAEAQAACATDKDCPGTACGGQVCLHSSGSFLCVDANTVGASGSGDGWCADSAGNAVDSNCKCAPQGATCLGLFCTFTVPAATGTGGTSGAGGASGTGGSTGSGGATGNAGTSGGGGGGGGCSVAGAPSFGAAAGVALLAAALMRRRARRRA